MGITSEQFKSLKPRQRVKIVDMDIWEIPMVFPDVPFGKIGTVQDIYDVDHIILSFRINDVNKTIKVHKILIEKIIEEESSITIEEFQQLRPGQKVRFKTSICTANSSKKDVGGKIWTIDITDIYYFTTLEAPNDRYHYAVIDKIINNENKSEIPPSEPESLFQRLRREDQKEKKRLETQEQERKEKAWTDLVTEISKPRKTLFRFEYVVEDLKVAGYLRKRLFAEGIKCNVIKTHENTCKLIVLWN